MEKEIKKTIAFFDKAFNTLFSLVKILIKSKLTGGNFPKLNSSTCIVMGNGPSLKISLEEDLSFIQKQTLFCVNSFALTKEYKLLKPANYVMIDPGYWDKDREDSKITLAAIIRETTWELNVYMPYDAAASEQVKNLSKANPNIKIHYHNYVVFKGFKKIAHFFYTKGLAMPQCQNVVVASLFIAINSGIKNIYLIGADQNWHLNTVVNEKNELCMNDAHFYNSNDPRVLKNLTMELFFQSLVKLFVGYNNLQAFANAKKATIYNASKTSFIDAFPRKKLE